MALIPYTKAHATTAQRIAHLRVNGLIISRPNVAARKIEAIGYERLRIYFLSRRQKNAAGKPFVAGTKYHDIIRLYECDASLRDACFLAVGQFELLLRNSMSETLSAAFGSHPYYHVSAFKDPSANLSALQTFAKVYETSKDRRAKHYRETYSTPVLPPIWTMKEFLSFGASSRIFQCLEGSIKTSIAAQFGVGSDQVLPTGSKPLWICAICALTMIGFSTEASRSSQVDYEARAFQRRRQTSSKRSLNASTICSPNEVHPLVSLTRCEKSY